MTFFLLRTFKVESVSMEPALSPGDTVIVSPLAFGIRLPWSESLLTTGNPDRGDLVLARSPNTDQVAWYIQLFDPLVGFLTLQKVSLRSGDHYYSNNQYALRRVIALPGDTIIMRDDIVMIKEDGVGSFQHESRLSENDYRIQISERPEGWTADLPFSGTWSKEITLGEGEYFLMGDHRGSANDSSVYGPVDRNQIVGKVLMRYWPALSLLRK